MAERNKVVEVVGPPDRKTCAWEARLSGDEVSSERFLEFQLWQELYMKGTFEESLLGARGGHTAVPASSPKQTLRLESECVGVT
jgi:hypothetical protein